MPRKSTASLSVIRPAGAPKVLRPPSHLSADLVSAFHEIVATTPASHFRASDAPLVERYAVALVLARQANDALASEGPVIAGRVNPWITVAEKADRAIVALAAKLRLCPQARTDPKTAGRNAGPAPSAYEVYDGD
jgi:phage terminase small subunit